MKPTLPGTGACSGAASHRHQRRGSRSTSTINRKTSGTCRRRIAWAALGSAASSDDANDNSSSNGAGDGAGDLPSEQGGAARDSDGEKEEVTQESLASLVERTFVLAAAGNSYQMGIKAFISTIKEAYERGYTVPALTMEVSFVPTKTAGRDLHQDEVELRSIWIALVYLTLENANWPQKVQRAHEISAPFMDRFAEFVQKVMDAAAKGHTLQTLKLEEVMRRGAEPRTPLEQAVLSQSMRIVFATIDLMKEGWSGVQADQLRVLVPLYARPYSYFWNSMVEAGRSSSVSLSVVINPSSGPGSSAEGVYTTGMADLANEGIEVLCYVPTGFGRTDVSEVTRNIDKYESFYPSLCGGYFFDQGPATEENMWKYSDYYSHAQEVSGSDSTVVVNPGIWPHDSLYSIGDLYALENPDMGGQVVITSFENRYRVFSDGVPSPPRYLQDRYMNSILVYQAYFSNREEFLDSAVLQLYCANWGYVYFTDDGYDGNPWDESPSYFMELLDAVAKAPENAATCGTWTPMAFAPLGPGETRSPVPTPVPTAQPTILEGTRVEAQPAPVSPAETEGSWGQRRGGSSSFPSPATLLSGAVLMATALCYGVPL
eukprot:g10519.t1